MHAIRSRRTVLPSQLAREATHSSSASCPNLADGHPGETGLCFADATIVMDSSGGCITAVHTHTDPGPSPVQLASLLPPSCTFEDLGYLVVMAGLIDPYVSFGENCSIATSQSDIITGSKGVGVVSPTSADCPAESAPEEQEWDGFEFGTKVHALVFTYVCCM